MIRSAVVLPAPDGPSRATICGLPSMLLIFSEKPRSAAKVPPSFIVNSLPTSSTRSRVSSITGGPESGPGRHFDWSSIVFRMHLRPFGDKAVGKHQSLDQLEEPVFRRRNHADDQQVSVDLGQVIGRRVSVNLAADAAFRPVVSLDGR